MIHEQQDIVLPQAPPTKTGNNLFPVFLKIEQHHVLLVGGGKAGLEKLNALLLNAPDTKITLVGLHIHEEIRLKADLYPQLRLEERSLLKEDFEGKNLVIAAVNNQALSSWIRAEANKRGLLVNNADKPSECDFYLGSIVRKGDLKIAISTNGKSPTIARRLKEVLQESIPDNIDTLLDNMNKIRSQLKGDFSDKVNQLNAITAELKGNPNAYPLAPEQKWKKIAYISLFAFVFMIAGHILFSFVPLQLWLDEGKILVASLDQTFYLMILAGFMAQLVDGALGMGYGVTSAAVLLGIGVPLPAISGSIHAAEMFSSGASGFSHYKFGNVNKKLFRLLLIPGVTGAIIGALLLSAFGESYAAYIRPLLATYTMLLGLKILMNAFKKNRRSKKVKRVGWLAIAGGFLDSFGGGGWGPLVTSTLIAKGKTPRYVIGTVSITEFFVTLASALTFFTMIGLSHWQVITGLIIGGVVAAPFAAKLAGRLPLKTMFIGVGSLVILWSLNVLIRSLWN